MQGRNTSDGNVDITIISCQRKPESWHEKAVTGLKHSRHSSTNTDQTLLIETSKSWRSFCNSAYFFDMSSYLPSHWSRVASRACTLRS